MKIPSEDLLLKTVQYVNMAGNSHRWVQWRRPHLQAASHTCHDMIIIR